MPTPQNRASNQECTLDELLDDADLLNEAQREKLQQVRDHLESIQAVKELLAKNEAKQEKNLAGLLKTLRERRAELDVIRGRR